MYGGDNDSADSSADDNEEDFVLITRYTIVILDCTADMKEDVQQCLTDLYTIYSALQTSAHIRSWNTGVLAIGCKLLEDDNPNAVLIQPKTFDLTRLQSAVRNFNPDRCTNQSLPLKDGIEIATDMLISQCRAKHQDIRNIVLITNNAAPQLDDPDDMTSAARTLSMNNIHFSILPVRFFSSSKFYNSFLKQLPDGTFELVKPERTFLETLSEFLAPPSKLQKTRFYYNEDNYFEMKSMKMFQIKYRSLGKAIKTHDGHMERAKYTQTINDSGFTVTKLLKLDVDNQLTSSTAAPSDGGGHGSGSSDSPFTFKSKFNKMCKIGLNEQQVTFTKEQLTKMDKKCNEPKHRALYLMYLGVNGAGAAGGVDTDPCISDDVRSQVLVPGHLKQDQTMFYSYWLYCVQNDLAVYCIYLTKKRPYLVLKPILYKDEPMFLQYCVGYANNYRCTNIPNDSIVMDVTNTTDNDQQQLTNIMGEILIKLKNNEHGFLDYRDSKLLFEEALLKAKRMKTEFVFENDGISIKEHRVDEKVNDLVQRFKLK